MTRLRHRAQAGFTASAGAIIGIVVVVAIIIAVFIGVIHFSVGK